MMVRGNFVLLFFFLRCKMLHEESFGNIFDFALDCQTHRPPVQLIRFILGRTAFPFAIKIQSLLSASSWLTELRKLVDIYFRACTQDGTREGPLSRIMVKGKGLAEVALTFLQALSAVSRNHQPSVSCCSQLNYWKALQSIEVLKLNMALAALGWCLPCSVQPVQRKSCRFWLTFPEALINPPPARK